MDASAGVCAVVAVAAGVVTVAVPAVETLLIFLKIFVPNANIFLRYDIINVSKHNKAVDF